MRKNKKSYFMEFDLWSHRIADKYTERMTKKYKASPIGYPLFQIGIIIFFFGLFITTLWFMTQIIKPIPFEVEGNCNTGFIGVDYSMDFRNEPYKREQWGGLSIARNFTAYNIEPYPKELNLKNIDGLNCNFKAKGAIPLNKLQELS